MQTKEETFNFENAFKDYFAFGWNETQSRVHVTALEKGWYDDVKKPSDRNQGEVIALIHSELSEALDGLRSGNPPSEKIVDRGFSQVEEEFADVVIRIMDISAAKRAMKEIERLMSENESLLALIEMKNDE